MTNGYVVYEGPSTITGAPIVAVLTLRSTNEKTGNIPQLWILDGERAPHVATKSGADSSVCGGCVHRPSLGGSCYVLVHNAPRAVWQAWQDGRYPPADAEKLGLLFRLRAPRALRLGAYGDPCAIPLPVLRGLVESARSAGVVVLGYTHRWRALMARSYRDFLMASVDSPAERVAADAAGWRTFRVRSPGEDLLPGERVCPAESDGMTCNACRRCDGMASPERASVVIHAHGSPSRLHSWRRVRALRGDL